MQLYLERNIWPSQMLRLQVILPVAQVCVFWNFLSTPQYIVCHYLGRKLWLSQSLRFQVLATLISHSKYRYFTVILLLERKLWPSQSLRLQQSVLYLELFYVYFHWYTGGASSSQAQGLTELIHSEICLRHHTVESVSPVWRHVWPKEAQPLTSSLHRRNFDFWELDLFS